MYPRNAASPERISIGPVIQIADGAVQSAGVSVSVLPMGAGSGAGGGTVAYENGVVVYTPLQAETNYTSVIFVAYKTGCIPASIGVVFSASGTPGYAGTDQAKITNPTATVALTHTSINDVATVGGEVMRGTDGAYTGTPPSASTIAGAVLDEAKGSHAGHLASIPTNPNTVVPDPAGTGAAIVSALEGIPLDATETQAAAAAAITAAAIPAGTVTALGTGSGFTAIPWNAAWDAEVQSECADAIAAAGLTGAGGIYTQTVTVTSDGTTPIPNATVEIWSGAVMVSTKKTSALGVASPSCNAGSFTLKVLASGYNDYSAALTVAGNATLATITLSAIPSTPSTEPNTVTVRWRVRMKNRTWATAAAQTVYMAIKEGPGSAGIINASAFDSDTTDANGYVEFANTPVGSRVAVKVGTDGAEQEVDIPIDAASPYDAAELSGGSL